MNTTRTLAVTAGSTLLLLLAVFLGAKLQENASLRDKTRQLSQQTLRLEEQVASLMRAANQLTAQFTEAEARCREAEAKVADAAAILAGQETIDESKSASQPTNAVLVRPYQLPLYLGRKQLGLAWAVPTEVQRDPKTGRVTCRQIIQLPEEARGWITTYVTNTVEQPVCLPPQVVERSYYVDRGPTWVGVLPAARHSAHTRFHQPALPAPAPGRPAQPPAVRLGFHVPPSRGDPGLYVPPGLR